MSTVNENVRERFDSDVVVVGIDGTEDGDRAVRYAVTLAKRDGLSMRLVHVTHQVPVYAPMVSYLPESSMVELGRTILRQAAQVAMHSGFDEARIDTVLEDGPRISSLVDHSYAARLVVLGTRSSAVEHFFTGSTSLSVAAHSAVPVVCVPRAWGAHSEPVGPVVAGLDSSDADQAVLEEAFREAGARGAQLTLVHAWRPMSPYDTAIMARTMRAEWERSARDLLTKQIEEIAGSYSGVAWALELDFERVPVALHAAAATADLVVVGRHGHLRPAGLAIGSNTRTLLRTATCPVVVVPVSPVKK